MVLIVCGDLAAAELRVFAALAGDDPWLECFATGRNPHLMTAAQLFGREVSKDEEEYTFAKSFQYRWIFLVPGAKPQGAGQLRMSKVTLTEDRLGAMVKTMERAHPKATVFKHSVITKLYATGKVWNVFGRFRDLSWGTKVWDPKVKAHVEQAALNWVTQTAIGHVINRAFLKFDRWYEEAKAGLGFLGHPCLQCHDEIGAWIPDGCEEEALMVARALKRCIEAPIPELGGMVIPGEIKMGPSWGAVKEVKV